MSKPLRMQFNQKGAWRNALDFDCSDPDKAGEVMHLSAQLAALTNATARIVMTDGSQTVVAHWSPGAGWRDAVTGNPL